MTSCHSQRNAEELCYIRNDFAILFKGKYHYIDSDGGGGEPKMQYFRQLTTSGSLSLVPRPNYFSIG